MKKSETILGKALSERYAAIQKTFLKEWTQDVFTTMQRKISAHFSGKEMNTHHGNYPAMYLGWKAISERLGLAYTSTSDYAGYWICNTEVISNKFPSYRYVGFAMSSDKKGYAVLWDKDENEILLPL